jgi:hypothetical protein
VPAVGLVEVFEDGSVRNLDALSPAQRERLHLWIEHEWPQNAWPMGGYETEGSV